MRICFDRGKYRSFLCPEPTGLDIFWLRWAKNSAFVFVVSHLNRHPGNSGEKLQSMPSGLKNITNDDGFIAF